MSDLRTLERDLRLAKSEVLKARNRAIRETAYMVKSHVVFFSSGTKTLAQLAAEDHPYAKRHSVMRYDPAIINAQTGVFRASWVIAITNIAGKPIYVVKNIASYAEYLEKGTRFMVARPIEVEAKKYAEQVLAHKISLYVGPAIQRALSG